MMKKIRPTIRVMINRWSKVLRTTGFCFNLPEEQMLEFKVTEV